MARKFTGIDLLGFSLLNALLNPVSSDPTLSSGAAGMVWFNSTSNTLKFWNGTAAIDVKDLGTATGTITSAKISDLAASVQAYKLNQFAAPNTDVSLASHKLTNVTDPSTAQDAATKNYVDSALSGVASGQIIKGVVRVAATTSVSLSSPGSAIHGITLTANDVVLLSGQTTGSQSGPYVWTASGAALSRASNWNTSALAQLGSYWIVEQGTYADNFALLTNDTAITLGTDTPTFTFVGSKSYTGGNGIAISGSTISALATTGITVTGAGIGADFAVVGRRITGIIPTTTSGICTISGQTVTINHGLSNYAPRVTLRAYTSPDTSHGFSQGQVLEVEDVSPDANNVTLTMPYTIGANQWYFSIVG